MSGLYPSLGSEQIYETKKAELENHENTSAVELNKFKLRWSGKANSAYLQKVTSMVMEFKHEINVIKIKEAGISKKNMDNPKYTNLLIKEFALEKAVIVLAKMIDEDGEFYSNTGIADRVTLQKANGFKSNMSFIGGGGAIKC